MPETTFHAVEINRKTNEILDHYQAEFLKLFGQKPAPFDDDDLVPIRWAVQHFTSGDLKPLISKYLTLENDFLLEQGYPLRYFRRHINGVIVASGLRLKFQPQYVVALSETGRPSCSTDPNYMGKTYYYKPLLMDDWLKQSTDERLQFSKEQWQKVGMNVEEWIENWKEWGFQAEGRPL